MKTGHVVALSFSTVSGDVNQAATVLRERCCLQMAPFVWREKTAHAWTLALDCGWKEERPLSLDVTTGQIHTNNSILQGTKKEEVLQYMFALLSFSTCEGGRLNCTREPCPGETNPLFKMKVKSNFIDLLAGVQIG